MTILFLIDQLNSMGGAERNLFQVVTAMKKLGCISIVACFQGKDISRLIEQSGIQVENLCVEKVYGYAGLKALLLLRKIISRQHVDLIVAYHESSDFIGIVLSLITDTPIISNRRDMGFKLKARHIFIYKLINRLFSHIVAVSSAVKKSIIKNQSVSEENVAVIYNGVDAEDGSAAGGITHGTADQLVICCLANIRPIKGHKYLIEAIKLISEKHPNLKVILLGQINDPQEYFLEIRDLIVQYKLENIMEFKGRVPPKESKEWLASADISVLPSLSEGFSNTILESMFVGLPVVATAVGGNSEVVIDGKSGYLVPPADPSALANALDKLLSNAELRAKMGEEAKQAVQEKFSVNIMISRYLDLFQYVVWKHNCKKYHVVSPVKHDWQKLLPKYFRVIKNVLAVLSCKCGIYSLNLKFKKIFKLGRAKILSFHNISPGFPACYSSVESPELFTQQIDSIDKEFQIVSLDKAVHLLETGARLERDVYAITFDDCYMGSYKYVLPVLEKYKIPATFFVSTSPLSSGGYHAYDLLMMYVEQTWKKVIDLSDYGLGVFLLDNDLNRFHFMVALSVFLRQYSLSEQRQYLYEISDMLGVDSIPEKISSQILDMNSFRKLAASEYVTLGGHSSHHLEFACHRDLVLEKDVKNNKDFLEKYSGEKVKFFAYPFGSFLNKEYAFNLLDQLGYTHAFILGGRDEMYHPYQIKRLNVHSGNCLGFDNKFSLSMFMVELSGLGGFLFCRPLINKIKSKIHANSPVY